MIVTQLLFTEEENQLAEPQVNTAIATVSTLLAVIIMMVGIYFAVLIGCKVAKSKERYTIIIWSLKLSFYSPNINIMTNIIDVKLNVQFKMTTVVELLLLLLLLR